MFGGDFQSAFECELNLARSFFARVPVGRNTGPLDNLGDKAFVAFLRRIPNADFIISGIGLHPCFHHGLRFTVQAERALSRTCLEKFVFARCGNQHARRVRSPEEIAATQG